MALALITAVRQEPSGPVLEVECGSNRFLRYSVGSGRRRDAGFDVLEGVSYESHLRPRLGTSAFGGRVDLAIDPSRLERGHEHVQVTTFREADGTGPAWSDVVSMAVGSGHVDQAFPEFRRPTMTAGALTTAAAATRSIPMSIRESSMSAAMDWSALLGLVDDLAPLAQQVLELAADDKVQAGASGLAKILGPLFTQLMGGAGGFAGGLLGTSGVAAPTAPVAAQPAPRGSATGGLATSDGRRLRVVGTTPAGQQLLVLDPPQQPMAESLDGGVLSIPAIIGLVGAVAPAAMKALQPLLEKSPEMLEAYLDHPIKLLNAIGDQDRRDQELINRQVDSLLAQGNQQLLLTMLQGLGQGAGSNNATSEAIAGLTGLGALGGLGGRTPPTSAASTLRSRSRRPASRSRVMSADERVIDDRIEAILIAPVPLPGAHGTRSVYSARGSIALRLSLTTPLQPPTRPIPKVGALVRVRDAATSDLLLERRIELTDLHLNQPVDVVLEQDAVATLPTGRDLNASVDVTWAGRDGAPATTPQRAVQNIHVVASAFIIEQGSRTPTELALVDPQRHRAFWHRVWEGGSARHSRWELNANARYFYTLTTDQPTNGRMETKLKLVDDRSSDSGSKVEWGGLLKSGMELAPEALNLLLPELGETPWSPSDLDALKSEVVARSVATKAEFELHLRGRTEERGAVWVFPIVSMVELQVHEVAATDATGAVVATTSTLRRFPLPVSAVVVGMENEG